MPGQRPGGAGATAAGTPANSGEQHRNPRNHGGSDCAGFQPAGRRCDARRHAADRDAHSHDGHVAGADDSQHRPGRTRLGTSQNPNHVVGPNNTNGTQTRLGNLPYAGTPPGSLPNQAYGPYGSANGANGNTAGNPFTNNPNMAAGAYLTPGYPGTGQFGAYAPYTYGNGSLTAGMAPQGAVGSGYYGSYSPNSYGNRGYGNSAYGNAGYGNSGYVPGYGASFGSNAAGNYTAGYAPANAYYPVDTKRAESVELLPAQWDEPVEPGNSAARPAAQGRTQYGWW